MGKISGEYQSEKTEITIGLHEVIAGPLKLVKNTLNLRFFYSLILIHNYNLNLQANTTSTKEMLYPSI